MYNLQSKTYPDLQGFGGINTGVAPFNIQDIEATEMLNISSDDFPALSQPKGRTKVWEGVTDIKHLGALFDGSVFCIAKRGTSSLHTNEFAICYYYDGGWIDVALDDEVQGIIENADEFTSTNFTDEKTILATGYSYATSHTMITITSPSAGTYSASIITPQTVTRIVDGREEQEPEPVPEYVDFVSTKSQRLLTASRNTDVLGGSQYRETRWLNADDIQFFYVQTEAGSYATGLVVYNDYALYFKRNSTHILYGNNRDSYSLDMLSGSVGCVDNKTIAETNTALMWLAADGVYAYSATTLPYKISEPIKKYIDNHSGNAAAASDGRKYYLSLKQADGSYVLCIYDTQNRQWNIEGNAGYKMFLRKNNIVYASDGNSIYELNSGAFDGEWLFITKPFDLSGTSGKMNIYRIYLNIRAKKGAVLDVSLSPDISSDKFINVHRQTFLKDVDGKIPIYLRPNADLRNLNYFRVKLKGKKECRIYAMEVELRARRGSY